MAHARFGDVAFVDHWSILGPLVACRLISSRELIDVGRAQRERFGDPPAAAPQDGDQLSDPWAVAIIASLAQSQARSPPVVVDPAGVAFPCCADPCGQKAKGRRGATGDALPHPSTRSIQALTSTSRGSAPGQAGHGPQSPDAAGAAGIPHRHRLVSYFWAQSMRGKTRGLTPSGLVPRLVVVDRPRPRGRLCLRSR